MTNPNCVKFHQNPGINPITGSTMDIGSRSYQSFVRQCGSPGRTTTVKPLANTLTQQLLAIGKTAVASPTIPKIIVPKPATPQVTVPKITIPQVTVPKITIPQVTVPKITIPQVMVPGIITNTSYNQVEDIRHFNNQYLGEDVPVINIPKILQPIRVVSPPRMPVPGIESGQWLVDDHDDDNNTYNQYDFAEDEIQQIVERVREQQLPNQDRNQYIPQDNPTPREFAFTTNHTNSPAVQAGIETGRAIYPSFETYLQAADAANVYQPYTDRSLYPSYFQNASPFEIFRIYQGDRRNIAVFLLNKLITAQRRYAEEDNSEFDENTRNIFNLFMEGRGYIFQYLGYVNANHPTAMSMNNNYPLNAQTFQASITPEQGMMMEGWRLKALHNGIGTSKTNDILDMRAIINQRTASYRAPILSNIGFKRERLRAAVRAASDRLPIARGSHGRFNHITREYIRYEGENAINTRGIDISSKGLAMNSELPKTYYMMLYNELVIRGVIQ